MLIVSELLRSIGTCRAATADCADSRIEVIGTLDQTWTTELASVCGQLTQWTDVDPNVKIRCWESNSAMIVQAVTSDKRIAERQVTVPSSLGSTIEALAKIPHVAPADGSGRKGKPSESATPSAIRMDASPGIASTTRTSFPSSEHATSSAHLRVESGAAVIGRIERATTSLSSGPTAWAGLHVNWWLMALQLRWDPAWLAHHPRTPEFELDSFGVGVLAARRISLAPALGLDAGITSWILNEAYSYQGPDAEVSGATTDVRIGALTRAHVGRGQWQWVLSVEGECSPARLRRTVNVRGTAQPFPSYSLGLGIGVSWSGS